MRKLLLLFVVTVSSIFAADIAGKWAADERTFTFKVDGSTLTGETESERAGKSTIDDGKIDGDDISFKIKGKYEGSDFTATFKGKVVGDEIRLHMEVDGGGYSADYVAKKSS